jgi:hypothetical protein
VPGDEFMSIMANDFEGSQEGLILGVPWSLGWRSRLASLFG